MIYLLLCILCSVLLFLAFRSYKTFKINTLQAVVVNYYICVVTGWITFGKTSQLSLVSFENPWFKYTLMLGAAFMLIFFLTALTTQLVSVTVGSLASKTSLVVPVIFSLYVFKTQQKTFDWINYAGIVLALVAIVLSTIKKSKDTAEKSASGTHNGRNFLLALLVFLLSGLSDTTLNYLNYAHIRPETNAMFLIILFGVAALSGTLFVIFRVLTGKDRLLVRNLVGGVYLGIPNFFSLYFLLKALSAFNNDGAFIFPILNIGIILLSSILAVILFKERLSRMNQVGIMVAILAMFCIAYQEIMKYMQG
ncbi:MAG TPA: hypothetical protein DCS93_29535 [Microscillaceae bacterium]|nr:hypothetical protein [Microscillaceae bacterium]